MGCVGAFRMDLLIGVRGRNVNRVRDRAERQSETSEAWAVPMMGPVDTRDEIARIRSSCGVC